MKKTLVIVALLAAVAMPMVAAAQTPQDCCVMRRAVTIDAETADAGDIVGPTGGTCDAGAITVETNRWGLFCLINTVNAIIDWIFIILIAVVMLFVAIGAFNILTSAGAPEKVSAGRNYILYAAVGLLIALLARAVPALVLAIIG